jgi:hypothetical protein
VVTSGEHSRISDHLVRRAALPLFVDSHKNSVAGTFFIRHLEQAVVAMGDGSRPWPGAQHVSAQSWSPSARDSAEVIDELFVMDAYGSVLSLVWWPA